MSLQRSLTRAFALVICLVLLCGAVGATLVLLVGHSTDELESRVQPMRLAAAELDASLHEASRGVRGYVLTGEPRFLESFDRGVLGYAQAGEQLRELTGDAERPLVERQDMLAQTWLGLYPDLRTGGAQSRPAPEAIDGARIRRGQDVLDQFLLAHEELNSALAADQRRLQNRAADLRLTLLLSMAGIALVATTVALATGLRITRAAGGSLAALAATVERLAAGDGSARVQLPERAPREVEVVAASLNGLADEAERLRRTRDEIAEMRELARIVGLHIRSFLTVAELADETAAALGTALGAHRVTVRFVAAGALAEPASVWAEGRLEVAPGPAIDSEDCGSVPPGLQEAYASGTAVLMPSSDLFAQITAAESAEAGGAGAVGLFPFGSGDRVHGLLAVVLADEPSWGEAALEFAELVTSDLGRGVQHAHLYADQRRVIEQLRELDQAKSDFLSTVSHELRTPLTSIAGYTELLTDEGGESLTPAQTRMLDVIARNTLRLQGLIEDLLTLSRMEAGAFAVAYAPVATSELVAAVAGRAADLLAGRQLELDIVSGPAGYAVLGDSESLERMLLNLVANAVKFTPDGGRVGIHAAITGGSLAVAVSDTGIGIPEEEQKRLFNRFFRASNATSAAIQGTGLGLTIAHSIALHHGGTVHVRSREQAGTTVEVRLPLLRSPDAGLKAVPASVTDVLTIPAPRT